MTSALVTQWEVGNTTSALVTQREVGNTTSALVIVGSGKHDQCFGDTVGSGETRPVLW